MLRLSSRRSLWAPGLVVIGVSIGVAAMLGITSGGRTWPLWIAFLVAAIAAVGWLDRRLHPAEEEPPAAEPERRRPRPGTGGKVYDLEQDRSTDKQRYLM